MTDSDYKLLDSQLHALLGDEPDALAAASNFVALLYNAMDDMDQRGVETICQAFCRLQESREHFI